MTKTKTIAVCNQKGGVGKTATAVNLAAALAEGGSTVLLIDMDPQTNATTGVGCEPDDELHAALVQLRVLETATRTKYQNLWVLAGTRDMAGLEFELTEDNDRHTRLRRVAGEVASRFDFVLIDCPPTLGVLSVNAMTMAGEVIVPVCPDWLSVEGMSAVVETLESMRTFLNPRLRLGGLVLCMWSDRTRLAREVKSVLQERYGELLLTPPVPRSVRAAEASMQGSPVIHYRRSSSPAVAYRAVAELIRGRP